MQSANVIQRQPSSEIVQLQKSQVLEASAIAARAFENDPAFTYMISDDREFRLQSLAWLTGNMLDYAIRYGHVYTTPDLEGIAAWLPPGKSASSPLQQIKMAWELQMYALPTKVRLNRLGQCLKLVSSVEHAHQQDMGDFPMGRQGQRPHWYLALMLVNPSSQGKGIGSQLLQPVLQRASDEGMVCYLSTCTEQAVRFYQKNGFEVMQTQKVAPDAPPFWTMKRNPLNPQ
ncbi:MAG: GNAT family N-acetyltransferase [Cyanobacteria bacterium P01_F01_bin.150]